jgi:hypothetical protein
MNKKQFIPLGLLLIFLSPLLIASVMFVYRTPMTHKTVNHGQLLNPPINISAFIPPTDEKQNWQLAYYLSGPCETECVKNIYYIEQIKKALGKKQHYLTPLFMTATPLSVLDQQQLKAHYPHVHYQLLNASVDQQWQNTFHHKSGLYMIDPENRVMMAYADEDTPKNILKDIQRLLRNTQ